jgi:hypothetical protein
MKPYQFAAVVLVAAIPFIAACDDDDDDGTEPTATNFTVALAHATEVPVCATAGANSLGAATVTINAANTSIAVNNLTFSGLSGAATMAHIHSGAVGVAGPIVIDFGATVANPLTSGFTHTYTSTDYIAAVGAPASFGAFLTAAKAGNAYINIHTPGCGSGEIRGQLVPVT